MTQMEINDVIDYILKHDLKYPGEHQYPTDRTKRTLKNLSAKAQLQLIWKCFCKYIEENLENEVGVNIKHFGSFEFRNYNAISVQTNIKFSSSLVDRKKLNIKRIIFMLSKDYQKLMPVYFSERNKCLFDTGYSFEKKIAIDWNPYQPAKRAALKDDVFIGGIEAILQCIFDLVEANIPIFLDFEFCYILIKDKMMACSLDEEEFESRM